MYICTYVLTLVLSMCMCSHFSFSPNKKYPPVRFLTEGDKKRILVHTYIQYELHTYVHTYSVNCIHMYIHTVYMNCIRMYIHTV